MALSSRLDGIWESNIPLGEKRWIAARTAAVGESRRDPFDRMEQLLASAGRALGLKGKAPVSKVKAELSARGLDDLAKRVARRSKDRNVAAHPDVELDNEVVEALQEPAPWSSWEEASASGSSDGAGASGASEQCGPVYFDMASFDAALARQVVAIEKRLEALESRNTGGTQLDQSCEEGRTLSHYDIQQEMDADAAGGTGAAATVFIRMKSDFAQRGERSTR